MRYHLPEVEDDHLYALEKLVRARIEERSIDIKLLMGSDEGLRIPKRVSRTPERSRESVERTNTFEFTSRVPEKNLRCLNI